jgi:hypothetical protein
MITEDTIDPNAYTFYHQGLTTLHESQVPFLVGGAYALERYTGIVRYTKDFDIFVHPRDHERALQALTAAGYQTDLTFPHWLGKAFSGDHFIDVIFGAGNGICTVDDEWFEHAIGQEILGLSVQICPAEEMIWSKAFVGERERYDGADIAHILRVCSESLAWPRLLRRFDAHWRVLLSHLVLFGFIYPAERGHIPAWVMEKLIYRLQNEVHSPPPTGRVCQGTLISREQYLIDIMRWDYGDVRLLPKGGMTSKDIAHWTAAIDEKKK